MRLNPATSLPNESKLQQLRNLDRFRHWSALDDRRYCLCCGKIISGCEIQVVQGPSETDPLRLVCPTEGCTSIAMDWVLPTNDNIISATPVRREAGLARDVRVLPTVGRDEVPIVPVFRIPEVADQ